MKSFAQLLKVTSCLKFVSRDGPDFKVRLKRLDKLCRINAFYRLEIENFTREDKEKQGDTNNLPYRSLNFLDDFSWN